MKSSISIALASCVISLISLGHPSAQAQTQDEPLRVGIYQNRPKIFLDDRGQPAGFWVDILNTIASDEDWTIEYVPCDWERCLQALEAGQLDLMMDVAYSQERDRRFDFNHEVVLASWSVIYRKPGISINSLLDLDQRRIAILGDSIQGDALAEEAASFGIQPEFVAVENFSDIFQLLDTGQVDAGIVNNFIGQAAEADYDIVKTNILLYPARLHFAVPEGEHAQLLNTLDQHLRHLTLDASSIYYQAQAHWLEPLHGQRQRLIRETLWDLMVYVPVVGVIAFALWNRVLSREMKRRQQTETQFQALADNAPGVIYQYLLRQDGSEALVYASSRCLEVWGVNAAAAVEDINRLWVLIHPDDLKHMRAAIFRSARSLTPWAQEWRVQTPDGQHKWLQAKAIPQRLENGDVLWDGFVFDITERKTAEIALRKSESRFQKLADNVPGILYGYLRRPDGTDQFTYISSGFEEVYGFPPDSALEDSTVIWRMTHPDDIERLQRGVIESHQTLQVWQAQYRVTTPTGERKWLQGIARPTQQPNGDVVWDGLIIDISDRKQVEEALQYSEQRFRNMAANVPGAIFQYVLHPDGTDGVNYMSPGCANLWEVTAAAAQQDVQILWDMVHPDDRAAMSASVWQSAQTLQPWSWQWRIMTPTGQVKWLEAAGRPEKRDNGDIVWDSLVMDISDRKQAEDALKTSENRLNTLISNLPGFVYRVANDRNYTAEFVSQGVFDITGYPPEAYLGPNAEISLGEQIHPHDRERVWHLIQRCLQHHQPYECEYRILIRSGNPCWVWERGQGIFDDQGTLYHLEGFVTDISDRKRTELALQESEIRYRQVVEAQTDFILRSLPDTTITFANDALCQALGLSPAEVVGKKWSEFVNAEDLEQTTFHQLAHLCPDNPRCFVENRDTRANGQIGWTQWLNEGVFDDLGQLVEIQSVGRDITELKQIEEALRNSEERFRLVTENMSDLVCLHQIDGQFTYTTPSSQALLGYLPEALVGQDWYQLIHPDDHERVREQITGSTLSRQARSVTYRIRHHDGHFLWLESLAKPIFDEQGRLLHLQVTSRNVSDRIKVEQQLKHDALHDGLTHLPNRNRLIHRLDLALKRTHTNPKFQFAVLFLDLDNFKVVNDSLGHLVGDELLIAVADQLKRYVRDTDIAARLGGDEFVILIEEISDIREAVAIAERILQGLRSPFKIAERDVFISTSIGIVVGTANHQRAADLLRDADLAMYRAKHSGRAQYAIFDPAMHFQVIQRLHLEQDLRQALERKELVLFYQPIVDLETLHVVSFEALVRWQHPQRGLVSPLEFIPIAEETGLIVAMGRWILRTACQQLAEWQTQFPSRGLTMSVNLSVQQLQDTLITNLQEALDSSQIPPQSLVLEITESMLVKNVHRTQALLEQIREMAIRLSIDDFGTGYSSLSYLSKLPVDTLKIDRAFVSPEDADVRNQVIAESIIALSNLLELGVIAEGIQAPEQLLWLKQLGCRQGQGYLFSPPVPADEATLLLRQALSLKP